jgi:hypothetical protein
MFLQRFFKSDSFSCECGSECYSILTSLNILKRVGPAAAHLHPTSESIPPTALIIETKKCLTRRNLVNKSPRYVTGSDATLMPLSVDVVVVKMSVRSHSIVHSTDRRRLLGGDPSDGHVPRPGVL